MALCYTVGIPHEGWLKMAHIEIERPDDETMIILVGGVEIVTVTHDEHGWSGMGAVEAVTRGIGRELHVWVEDK